MYISARYLTLGFSVLMLLLSVAMIIYSGSIRDPGVQAFYMGSAFMPRLWLIGVAITSLIIAAQSLTSVSDGKINVPIGYLSKTLLAMAAYVFSLSYVGYLFSTFLFLMLSARLMGERRWGIIAISSAIFTATAYLFFLVLLRVSIPATWA